MESQSPQNKNLIKGRLRELFGIPTKLLPKLKYQLKYLYSNNKFKFVSPESLHQIVINLFASDYFPIVSRNIRTDKFNYAVIMGGMAFNMNIPGKMPFLRLDTDDIDLKIYSTDINYLEKDEKAVLRVLSVFRFSVIIICMYLKQILELIKNFANKDTFNRIHSSKTKKVYSHKKDGKEYGKNKEKIKQYIQKNVQKNVQKHTKKHTKKHSKQHIQQKNVQKNVQKNIQKYSKKQKGGTANTFLEKGILNNYQILIQLKKKDEHNVNKVIEKLDLSKKSYEDIFNILMSLIDDPDLLVTIKSGYNMQYGEIIKPDKFRSITFSDSKIIYPSKENPAFYSYYLMNNQKELGKPVDKLISENIPIDKIMETQSCGNNCKFTSINSLILDTTLMLSYADLLAYEDLSTNSTVLVPVGFLFKYYKYLTKYLRLFVVKKYYEGTLNGIFLNAAKNLTTYIWKTLKINTSLISETDEINIAYKKILNEFHQNLFINKKLLNEYPELKDPIDEYSIMIYYINNSRALFKKVDEKSGNVGESLESITIQMADQELSKHSGVQDGGQDGGQNGGQDGGQDGGKYSGKRLQLHSNYKYEDIELDNPEKGLKINKKLIISKIDNLLHSEINMLSEMENSISRR